MVPFLITGSFWGAGDSSRKIKTIDIMWLRKLFKDGVVWYQGKHDEPLCKKIGNHQFVSSEELLEQLEQPFYREIFNIKPVTLSNYIGKYHLQLKVVISI
ncbi:MAG: hypothetical protein H6Q69_3982 [Firmicutes bacterium]|nr:hypothetical protein [Bacillota bacterium]